MEDSVWRQDLSMICIDCSVDTVILNEFYMVCDDLWISAVQDQQDREQRVLCVGCLEVRIGRKLRASDFTDAPINKHKDHSARLLDRLTASS